MGTCGIKGLFTPRKFGLEPKEVEGFDWKVGMVPRFWVYTKSKLGCSSNFFQWMKILAGILVGRNE
jgi:hypothetical protein